MADQWRIQEAADRIQRVFLKHGVDDKQLAEEAANCIAPLMVREFPEEEMRNILRDNDYSDGALFVKDIKALWEGEQPKGTCRECAPWGSKGYKTHGMLGAGAPYDCPACNPKGTCQTCGGRKRIPCGPEFWQGYDICSDCDGTVECQHKGKWAYASADNDNWLPRCLDCKQEVERRSGEEQRKTKGRRALETNLIGEQLPYGKGSIIAPVGGHRNPALDRRQDNRRK